MARDKISTFPSLKSFVRIEIPYVLWAIIKQI